MALTYTSIANASSLKKDLDAVIFQAIQSKRIVGTVVMVCQNGKIIYQGAYGFRDREANIPMTMGSLFRYASLTKPIVTIAALKLIDEGKLNLNDPVTKWIPEFLPKTSSGKVPIITIRQLLTHTAGLNYGFSESREGPYHRLAISDGLDKVNFSLNENIARLAKAPLLFEPGTAWNYSLATDVLGEILQRVAHQSLPKIVEKLVLNPLGIKNTTFNSKNSQMLSISYINNKPQPTRMRDGGRVPFGKGEIIFSPSRAFDKNSYPSGGAGMIGTGEDYLRFLESIRTRKIGLTKNTYNALTSNQIGSLNSAGPGWGWTLGFSILKNAHIAKSPQAVGTYQWGGVYGNTWWVDPTNKLSVVILTNTALEGMSGKFPQDIRDMIYKHINTAN